MAEDAPKPPLAEDLQALSRLAAGPWPLWARREAIGAIERTDRREAVQALLELACHDDADLRSLAMDALFRLGHGEAVMGLAGALKGLCSAGPSLAAGDIALRLGSLAAPVLFQLLRQPGGASERAAHLLARIGISPRGVVRTSLDLQRDHLRALLLRRLSAMQGAERLPILRESLDDPAAEVRLAALTALSDLDGAWLSANQLRGLLKDPDRRVRRAAAESLGKLQDTMAGSGLPGQPPKPQEHRPVSPPAGPAEVGTLEALCAALDCAPAVERGRAALSLGKLGDPAALPCLERAYRSPEPTGGLWRVWNDIAGAAADLGSPLALDWAILEPGDEMDKYYEMEGWRERVASGRTRMEARAEAQGWPALGNPARAARVEDAGRPGNTSALPWLEFFLYDPSPQVCRAAVRAAGHIGGDGALRILEQAFRHSDRSVRAAAAEAVGILQQHRGVPGGEIIYRLAKQYAASDTSGGVLPVASASSSAIAVPRAPRPTWGHEPVATVETREVAPVVTPPRLHAVPGMELASAPRARQQPARPGFVTASVLVVAVVTVLAAVLGGGIVADSGSVGLGAGAIVAGIFRVVVLAGLWRMKNWARLVELAVLSLALLGAVIAAVAAPSRSDLPVGAASLLLALAHPVYWFVTHGDDFD